MTDSVKTSKPSAPLYAVIWPDGRILADTTWKTKREAIDTALGWPDKAEMQKAYDDGVRVHTVRVIREIME